MTTVQAVIWLSGVKLCARQTALWTGSDWTLEALMSPLKILSVFRLMNDSSKSNLNAVKIYFFCLL